MREIKFRTFINGKMRTDCLMLLSDGSVDLSVHTLESEGIYIGTEENPVMQYTGLVDKKGVEIYEGDILRTLDGVATIEWCSDPQHLAWVARKGGQELEYWWPDCEVIGNIYENHELLTP